MSNQTAPSSPIDGVSASAGRTTGPLFVLSVPRAGSSLLYTLLNQHSQIALLYEGDLPVMRLFLWGQFRNGGWRQRWEFWNQGPSRHGLAIDSLPTNVVDVWEATRLAYQMVADRKQAKVWGEKTPHWYDSPLRMGERFPDARFIFLWRDLDVVMASLERGARTEIAFQKLVETPAKVLLENEQLRHACDALRALGSRVHEVNYEDLIANTPGCIHQICEFLEIPFEERMTSLDGADRSAIYSREPHEMVRGDAIVGRRKSTDALSPALRAKIDRYICRWRQHSGGNWPKYSTVLRKGTPPPSLFEAWNHSLTALALLLGGKVLVIQFDLLRS